MRSVVGGWIAFAAAAASLAAPASAAEPVAGLARIPGSEPCLDPAERAASCLQDRAVTLDGIALDPSERFAYVASREADAVVVLRRDAASGRLRRVAGTAGCVSQDGSGGHCATARGLRGASEVAVSPDGGFLYVGARVPPPANDAQRQGPSSTVAVFRRDSATGALAQLPDAAGCHSVDGSDGAGNACTAVRGPAAGGRLLATADGRHLYSVGEEGIAAFAREPDGGLAQLPGAAGCVAAADPACMPARTLRVTLDGDLSPDGRTLYAASYGVDDHGGLALLDRDPESGALSQPSGTAGCVVRGGAEGCADDPLMSAAQAVTASGDGRHVYVAARFGFSLLAFARTPDGLARVGCVRDTARGGCGDAALLFDFVGHPLLATGGRALYVPTDTSGSFAGIEQLRRDPDTGAVAPAGCTAAFLRRCPNIFLSGPTDLAGTRDGIVYALGNETMAALAPGLALPRQRIVLTRDGVARIRARCDADRACVGTATLQFAEEGETLGSGRISVPRRATRTIAIRLSERGRGRMRVYRSIGATVVARIAKPGAPTLETRMATEVAVPRGGLPGGRRSRPCLPGDAELILRTSAGTVFRRLVRTGDGTQPIVHGCLFATGRARRLEDNQGDYGTFAQEPFAMRGRYVAFPSQFIADVGPGDDDTTDLVVVDLRTGRTFRRCLDCGVFVERLVMKPNGSVAWSTEVSIEKMDRTAPRGRTIDESDEGIDPRSLRLRGSTLSWVRDGRRRTATLR